MKSQSQTCLPQLRLLQPLPGVGDGWITCGHICGKTEDSRRTISKKKSKAYQPFPQGQPICYSLTAEESLGIPQIYAIL